MKCYRHTCGSVRCESFTAGAVRYSFLRGKAGPCSTVYFRIGSRSSCNRHICISFRNSFSLLVTSWISMSSRLDFAVSQKNNRGLGWPVRHSLVFDFVRKSFCEFFSLSATLKGRVFFFAYCEMAYASQDSVSISIPRKNSSRVIP